MMWGVLLLVVKGNPTDVPRQTMASPIRESKWRQGQADFHCFPRDPVFWSLVTDCTSERSNSTEG